MKKIKLLIVTFLFSSLLAGCGMKGPLYRSAEVKSEAIPVSSEQIPQVETISNQVEVVPSIDDTVIIVEQETAESSVAEIISNSQEDMTLDNKSISESATTLETSTASTYVDQTTNNQPADVQPAVTNELINKDTLSSNSRFTPKSKLLTIPASHFSLQLAALDSSESLNNFIKAHDLPQPNIYVYETQHNKKPRYIILFGEYTTHQFAKMAGKSLPGSFANMDNWIKQYQVVHQELVANY